MYHHLSPRFAIFGPQIQTELTLESSNSETLSTGNATIKMPFYYYYLIPLIPILLGCLNLLPLYGVLAERRPKHGNH